MLRLVGDGRANKEIAAELSLSERTVSTHVSSILGKLGLSSRTQAALWAAREGLVDLDAVVGLNHSCVWARKSSAPSISDCSATTKACASLAIRSRSLRSARSCIQPH